LGGLGGSWVVSMGSWVVSVGSWVVLVVLGWSQ